MDINTNHKKATLGTVAAGAMALATLGAFATPAVAANNAPEGASFGPDAAIAGAAQFGDRFDNSARYDRRYRERDYRDGRYREGRYRESRYRGDGRRGYRGDVDRTIERCFRAAEREARRAGYRYVDVTGVRDVQYGNLGPRIQGWMEVDGGGRWRGPQRGGFFCWIDRDDYTNVRFSGIRGLRW